MADMKTSRVWRIVEEWLDVVPFPPSQSKIAEHLGVSRSAVSDWKSGKTRPDPEHLDALAQMMAPQLGPDVEMRLVIAVLADLGYKVDQYIGGLLKMSHAEGETLRMHTKRDPLRIVQYLARDIEQQQAQIAARKSAERRRRGTKEQPPD